jgi:hypothetical protein
MSCRNRVRIGPSSRARLRRSESSITEMAVDFRRKRRCHDHMDDRLWASLILPRQFRQLRRDLRVARGGDSVDDLDVDVDDRCIIRRRTQFGDRAPDSCRQHGRRRKAVGKTRRQDGRHVGRQSRSAERQRRVDRARKLLVTASMSCPVIRTRPRAFLKPPSST